LQIVNAEGLEAYAGDQRIKKKKKPEAESNHCGKRRRQTRHPEPKREETCETEIDCKKSTVNTTYTT
jgi:hypothetical protein